jgi:hypothetical protein
VCVTVLSLLLNTDVFAPGLSKSSCDRCESVPSSQAADAVCAGSDTATRVKLTLDVSVPHEE